MINNKNKIIILRHGETPYNATGGRVQTHDVPLSENGINQAKEVIKKLVNFPIEQIITSNLSRAMHTGDIVAEGLNLQVTERHNLFNERDQGILKGLTHEVVRSKYPECWNFEEGVTNFLVRPINGENIEDLRIRTDMAIQYINSLEKNTLIVSHGGFIRCLLSKVRNITDNKEIKAIEIPNCSYFELN